MWKREELNNMKVLVTGVKGQLGYDIVKECEKRNIGTVGVDIDEMDITNPTQVEEVIKDAQVDAVIHCAAWTAVDKAEDEIEICRKVNKDGPANIAKVCEELDIPMMYFSTDYVFNGSMNRPYREDDNTCPNSVYGTSKLMGENFTKEFCSKYFRKGAVCSC